MIDPTKHLPELMKSCPWHKEGVTGMQLDELRTATMAGIGLPHRSWHVTYACGCWLKLTEDARMAKSRYMKDSSD